MLGRAGAGVVVFNLCFSAELLRRELAWTRDDPLLELDVLARLRTRPQHLHRADMIARVVLALVCVARAIGGDVRRDPVHPAVAEVMRRIENQPAHNWTLGELADDLHLAPSYLVRLFKSVTGLPPIAFLHRHRVEVAAEMLLHTDRTIRAIADDVGWPDQNYFARRFRAHYGLSASEYRTRFTRRKRL